MCIKNQSDLPSFQTSGGTRLRRSRIGAGDPSVHTELGIPERGLRISFSHLLTPWFVFILHFHMSECTFCATTVVPRGDPMGQGEASRELHALPRGRDFFLNNFDCFTQRHWQGKRIPRHSALLPRTMVLARARRVATSRKGKYSYFCSSVSTSNRSGDLVTLRKFRVHPFTECDFQVGHFQCPPNTRRQHKHG